MAIQILHDVAIHGGIQFLDAKESFPENPSIGTMVLKGTAIYAYIAIGGMETWYPFANRTNSYVHVQGLPNTTWTINHQLHTTDVWIQVKDSNGRIVNATITATNEDTVTINFTTAITGTAVIVAPDSINVPEIKASLINVGPNVTINTSGVLINGSYALTAANIDQQIADAVSVEATARQSADTILQNAINTEASTRLSADSTITLNLNTETSVRTAADATLQANIDVEASTRDAADKLLQGKIDSEIIARQNADTTLQSAIDGKVSSSALGVTVATLVSGVVPSNQLPSYVDDVLEFSNLAAFPTSGESGKIYLAQETNKQYRWSGTQYVYITSGAVDSVNGKTGVVTIDRSDVGLGNVDDTPDTEKEVLSATKLSTARTISVSGDVSGSTSFDGSANASINTTLTNSGVIAGSYPKVTVNSKGIVTSGSSLLTTDIPDLSTTYQPVNSKLTGVSSLSNSSSGVIRLTNGVVSLDSAAYLTDNQTITVSGDATGSGSTAINLTLSNSGVSSGTYGSSSAIPAITVDSKGRITNVTTNLVSIPTGLTSGSTSTGFINYNGTTQATGQLDGGTSAPTGTTRLNYNGYFYATRFYGDGSQLTNLPASGATLADDTSTNAFLYPTFASATSGAMTTAKVSSTKLTFNPSTGQLNATVFNSTSDRNAKDNIKPIENALQTVKQIQGVSFTWKDTGTKSYGYIAQDIEEIVPEVVSTDAEGRKSVNYDATIAILLEAVKTLSAKVEELESKIS